MELPTFGFATMSQSVFHRDLFERSDCRKM